MGRNQMRHKTIGIVLFLIDHYSSYVLLKIATYTTHNQEITAF